jgi:hypothetical protein
MAPVTAPADPLEQAAALLAHPPVPAARAPGGRARLALRGLLLRALRPHTAVQRAVDERLVSALQQERSERARIQAGLERRLVRAEQDVTRLESLAQELITTLEAQRSRIARVEGRVAELDGDDAAR